MIFSYIFCDSKIVDSTFIHNKGRLHVDTFYRTSLAALSKFNILTLTRCEFRNNYYKQGSIIDVQNSDVSITDTRFINNSVGQSLCMFNSVISIDKSVVKHNYGSVITLSECIASIFSSVYDSNQEVGYQLCGAVVSYDSIIHIHSSEFKNNGDGTILCGTSLLTFYEVCTITDNHAAVGGAINIRDNVQCFIAHGATVIIANNSASSDGGEIYLSHHSNLTLFSHSVRVTDS